MSLLVVFFGFFITALGLVGMVSPERLIRVARAWQTTSGLYAAAALRIVLGAALFLVAPGSRAPVLFRILGVCIIVAGLATPFVGVERFRRVLQWWDGRSLAFKRLWCGFALGFGLWILYTVLP